MATYLTQVDQGETDVGAAVTVVTQPRNPDVAGLIQVREDGAELLVLTIFATVHDAADVAARDGGANHIGADVHVNHMMALMARISATGLDSRGTISGNFTKS